MRGLLVWSIARRLNAATHARRLFGATHAFNPKYNDFGFDSDQVSKLDNANLKTWPMSRRCHFRPPDPRLNYERIGRGVRPMSALPPKADMLSAQRPHANCKWSSPVGGHTDQKTQILNFTTCHSAPHALVRPYGPAW